MAVMTITILAAFDVDDITGADDMEDVEANIRDAIENLTYEGDAKVIAADFYGDRSAQDIMGEAKGKDSLTFTFKPIEVTVDFLN